MASLVRRAMVYLGLSDDDYDDYDRYEEAAPATSGRPPVRPYLHTERPEPVSSIRAVPREEPPQASPVGNVAPRPAAVRAIPNEKAKVHVVAPERFADAQQIGDRLRDSQPVIVNLQVVDRELSRRMIDFCSGVTYALGGTMDKVADQVFLLTPSNVEVSAEEKRRLSERGLYRS